MATTLALVPVVWTWSVVPEVFPLNDALAELVTSLAPVADRLGCGDELQSVLTIADRGPSYVRQREVVAAGGSLVDVVDGLVAELKLDQPATAPGQASLDLSRSDNRAS